MTSKYEIERLRNITKNRVLLDELLQDNGPPLTGMAKPKATMKRKQQASPSKVDKDEAAPQKKARTSQALQESSSTSGLRRSSRLGDSSQSINYRSDNFDHLPRIPSTVSKSLGIEKESTTDNIGNRLGKRKHNPKVFGHIPGVDVGTWWETRALCSTDAIHAPFVAGISGDARLGAYSVALSGGYDDDIDLGYAFTFTGSGGRDLKGTTKNPKNLRTAPQSSDQSFENHYNKSLQVSAQTKKPVRVIRGYKLQSKFAPAEGYRYDGLYTVERAWMEPGLNAKRFKVCKFAFKRIPGQPPLEEQGEGSIEDEKEE